MNLLIQYYGIDNLYFFISYPLKIDKFEANLKIIQKRIIKYLLLKLKFNFFIWSKY